MHNIYRSHQVEIARDKILDPICAQIRYKGIISKFGFVRFPFNIVKMPFLISQRENTLAYYTSKQLNITVVNHHGEIISKKCMPMISLDMYSVADAESAARVKSECTSLQLVR